MWTLFGNLSVACAVDHTLPLTSEQFIPKNFFGQLGSCTRRTERVNQSAWETLHRPRHIVTDNFHRDQKQDQQKWQKILSHKFCIIFPTGSCFKCSTQALCSHAFPNKVRDCLQQVQGTLPSQCLQAVYPAAKNKGLERKGKLCPHESKDMTVTPSQSRQFPCKNLLKQLNCFCPSKDDWGILRSRSDQI